MRKNALKMSVCSVLSAAMVTSTAIPVSAALTAGVTGVLEETNHVGPVAGVTLTFSNYMVENELSIRKNTAPTVTESTEVAEATETPEITEVSAAEEAAENPYADIAIAQVNNYVNIRSEASEEGEVLGKLYNNSAATVEAEENGWYKITSGTVNGYVKSEYVVVGNEELARAVSRRVATVNTETLFVREEPTTEAVKLGMVAQQDDLTVLDESTEGWIKVTIEEGEGYVASEYVTLSTEFVKAESKAEEEARLAKEEEERKAAAAAAAAALAEKNKSTQSDSSSNQGASESAPVQTYNPPTGGSGQDVANFACQFVGNPYVRGGSSLTNGADCSGFVMAVYSQFGVSLPHSSGAMRSCGYGVSLDEIQPGDIVCYSGHVGIYVGNNTIVHASTPSTGIKYTSPVNYHTILAIRRIF